MSHPPRSPWKRLTRAAWYAGVAGLVLLAIALTVVRLYFPRLEGYRSYVEQRAGEVLGQTVRIGRFDARLEGLTPTFVLGDVRLLGRAGRLLLHVGEVRVELALWESLRRWSPQPGAVAVSGIALRVTRQRDGSLRVQGLRLAQPAGDGAAGQAEELARWLFSRERLQVHGGEVEWRDARHPGRHWHFQDIEAVLENSGGRHRLSGSFAPPQALGQRLAFAADLEGEVAGGTWSGRIHLAGEDLDLAAWSRLAGENGISARGGRATVALWLRLRDSRLAAASGRLGVLGPRLVVPGHEGVLAADAVAASFRWRRLETGWRLALPRLEVTWAGERWPVMALALAREAAPGAADRLRLRGRNLAVEPLSRWLVRHQLPDAETAAWLAALAPAGRMEEFYVETEAGRPPARIPSRFSARFRDFSARATGRLPRVSGLGGEVRLDPDGGVASIHGGEVGVHLPRLFRGPWHFRQVAGRARWYRHGGQWHVESPYFLAHEQGLRAEGAFTLILPPAGAPPFLDLQARLGEGDAAATPRFLPAGIMEPELVAWLDGAIRQGRVSGGGVVFRGRLDHFPFRHRRGRFLVDFEAEDLRLKFRPDWPALEQARVAGRFTGTAMDLVVTGARLERVTLSSSRVTIGDLENAVLVVDTSARAGLEALAGLLAASPPGAGVRAALEGARFSGEGEARLHLELPLSPRAAAARPLRFQGRVVLDGPELALYGGRLTARSRAVRIAFDERSVSVPPFAATVLGGPAEFTVFTQQTPRGPLVRIAAWGEAAPAAVNRLLKALGRGRVTGPQPWQGLFQSGYLGGAGAHPAYLAGITRLPAAALRLPPPVRPAADGRIRVVAALREPAGSNPVLELELGKNLFSRWRLRQGEAGMVVERGAVRFGGPAALPPQAVLAVSGSPGRVPLRDWLAVARSLPGDGGALRLPVRLDLGRLVLVKGRAAAPPAAAGRLAPHDVPPVSGQVARFSVGDTDLGRLQVDLAHSPHGLDINRFDFHTGIYDIRINGSWTRRRQAQETALTVKARTSDAGAMVSRLGYRGIVEGGQGEAEVTLYWEDSPFAFAWDKVRGRARIELRHGSLREVEPGAGRLLGLLSLSGLARRLILDFRDLAGKGLHFDRLGGTFRIKGGDAFTDDLEMESTVGLVQVRGRTGLAARDFDQYIIVQPGVGDTVAVGSGMAFGAQVGVVVFLLDRLFGRPIDVASSVQYRVTGSWEAPVIRKIKAPRAPAADDEEDEDDF